MTRPMEDPGTGLAVRDCWCGNRDLRPFGPNYRECRECGTLVSAAGLPDEKLAVVDDSADFYGREYWLSHQKDDLGFPDIEARARSDLPERNLHWLAALLKYRLPPGDALELGCAHGGFVALMQAAGFSAAGLEMSPWVVDFARRTFDIPMFVGPVEEAGIAEGSLDVIALMDVLEHLPDPARTMAHCLGRLRPGGFLLIQTPQFREGMVFEELVASASPFLDQLKADEHLYLFSERAIREFFGRLGAGHVAFEPAIFAVYDMFLAVGREPLPVNDAAAIGQALLASPARRLVLALLDLRQQFADCERDRADRAAQVETLHALLRDSEGDRSARGEQIAKLTAMVKESESDRAARGEQIATLTALLGESESDRAARGEQIATLTALLAESEADRAARWEQIQELTRMVQALQSPPRKEG